MWATSGANSGKTPESNIVLGIGSTLRGEHEDLKLQFLDVDNPVSVDPSILATLLLRLAFVEKNGSEELL